MDSSLCKTLSAIIPAAGFSSRMKDFKPLLPFGGKTIAEHVIGLFKACGIENIVVVTGHNHDRLDPVVRNAGALPVFNPDFKSGMLSSIQKGVKNIRPENAGFFLLPVDIPAIRPSTIHAMIQKRAETGDQVLIPYFDNIPGHPPLIPSRMKPDILGLSNGSTLRDLFQTNQPIPVNGYDRGILMDADDKEGYESVLNKFLSLHIPDKEECLAIINDFMPENQSIRRHLADVSFTALKIGNSLPDTNPHLIIAAGLLHDIRKMEKDHAEAGARLLNDLGFNEVSKIVAEHMDIKLEHCSPVREKEIVYFADKICNGHGVDLNYHKRFADNLMKSPWAMTSISKRYEHTQLIQAGIEAAAGKSIREILEN